MSKSNGQSLLEKAKAVKVKVGRTVEVSDESIDLALAYIAGTVGNCQCAKALRTAQSNSPAMLGRVLIRAVQSGDLTIIDNRKKRRYRNAVSEPTGLVGRRNPRRCLLVGRRGQ